MRSGFDAVTVLGCFFATTPLAPKKIKNTNLRKNYKSFYFNTITKVMNYEIFLRKKKLLDVEHHDTRLGCFRVISATNKKWNIAELTVFVFLKITFQTTVQPPLVNGCWGPIWANIRFHIFYPFLSCFGRISAESCFWSVIHSSSFKWGSQQPLVPCGGWGPYGSTYSFTFSHPFLSCFGRSSAESCCFASFTHPRSNEEPHVSTQWFGHWGKSDLSLLAPKPVFFFFFFFFVLLFFLQKVGKRPVRYHPRADVLLGSAVFSALATFDSRYPYSKGLTI